MFLDELKECCEFEDFILKEKFFAQLTEKNIGGEKIILAKPQTYMNNSGKSVQALLNFYKIEPADLIVVADDLDIEIGKYKISFGNSSAGHNGIQSIMNSLGTKDFQRIRIGVEKSGGRKKRGQIPGEKFVLQNFTKEELHKLHEVFDEIIKTTILI